jgi:hypothetical protein
MRNMQCNVEYVYKLRMCSKTEENFGGEKMMGFVDHTAVGVLTEF